MSGPNHHDAFVKNVFSQPENARGELTTLLPAAVVAKLDFATLRVEAGEFVDERLKERHTDLLFSVKFRGGRDALVYVLFEHQSTVDPLLVVRLLVYMGRIWDDWIRRHDGAKAVPPIVPLVLSQGPRPWNAATSFHEAVNLEPDSLSALSAHLPAFRFLLDDLAVQSEEDIRAREMAVLGRVALLLLRHLREARNDLDAIRSLITRISDLLRQIPRAIDLRVAIAYILRVADADRAKTESALADALPDRRKDVVTVAEQLRVEGERKMFLRVLVARFGVRIPAELEGRVRSADEASLELWLSRVFTATSINAVFDPR